MRVLFPEMRVKGNAKLGVITFYMHDQRRIQDKFSVGSRFGPGQAIPEAPKRVLEWKSFPREDEFENFMKIYLGKKETF